MKPLAPAAFLACVSAGRIRGVVHASEDGRAVCVAGDGGVAVDAVTARGKWTHVDSVDERPLCKSCARVFELRCMEHPAGTPTGFARFFDSGGFGVGAFHVALKRSTRKYVLLCTGAIVGEGGLKHSHDDPRRRCVNCAEGSSDHSMLVRYAALCSLAIPEAVARCETQRELLATRLASTAPPAVLP